ncbi:MAG TPA: FkbM family methyltransferase [Gammaproteobacteria bacterium]
MDIVTARTVCALRHIAKKASVGGRLLVLQRVLRRLFHGLPVAVRIHDFDGDLTVDLRLEEHMQSRMFWVEYYNREVVSVLKRLLAPGMVLVDAGANIGEIAMIAAKRVGATGEVIAFEPVDELADKLETNIQLNRLHNVRVVRAGLLDSTGTHPIYASSGQTQREENDGLCSLYVGTDAVPIQTIQTTTLDRYVSEQSIRRVDIIKIDIEGAELACLRGAKETLVRFQPYLIVEVQRHSAAAAGYEQGDILDYLASFGYQFSLIGKKGRLQRISKTDLSDYQNVFCCPPGRLSLAE